MHTSITAPYPCTVWRMRKAAACAGCTAPKSHNRMGTWQSGLMVVGSVLMVLLASCDSHSVDPGGEAIVERLDITLNPSGYVPLAAEFALETTQPVQVEVYIAGRNSVAADVQHRFKAVSTTHKLPVLGLYPSTDNTVVLRFFDANGASLGEVSRTVTTDPLIAGMPTAAVTINRPGRKPGMHLVSYFGATGEFLPMTPVILDSEGAVRWYADFGEHDVLNKLFYDAGVERLANGDLYFGDGSSGRIVAIDMLGHVTAEWPIPGYGFHHNVLEMTPGGNLLATVNKHGAPTVEDHIIEIDRTTGAIVQEWDLRESLDRGRRTWSSNIRDWFHANGLAYDAANDHIIVSGRVQGTVKLTRNNEVVWILAPHRDWGTAGNGVDLSTKLLTPLDATDSPITVTHVLDGTMAHPDFDWAWYQHAPKLMPNGDLLLFDNGEWRHFADGNRYSRAVVYRIDDTNRTVKQVWDYGKSRGGATYSSIVSDVDYHHIEDNIVFMPGAVFDADGALGRIVEIDVQSHEVVYEAVIRPPAAQWGITFHRVDRLPLYPSEQ